MTRLYISSRPIMPRYQSAPYRQSSGRREHVHGPIQPMSRDTASAIYLRAVPVILIVAAVLAAGVR